MKTVIEMVHEAGMLAVTSRDGLDQLKRFAALVRADERNSWPAEMEAMELALEALETERKNYQDWDEEDGAPEYIHEAITALREALAEQPAPVQQEPVPEAMKIVIEAMRADPDYAWSWHCNIAMAFVDAGGDHYTGNQGAARFMKMLANVEPAHELPSPPAQPQQEPVAWVLLRQDEDGLEPIQFYGGKQKPEGDFKDRFTLRPVCFADAAPSAQRKPLTDEQIEALAKALEAQGDTLRHFARAIEAAHGIGVEK